MNGRWRGAGSRHVRGRGGARGLKPSLFALGALVLFTALWLAGEVWSLPGLDNVGLMSMLAVALVLVYYYMLFEEKETDTKTIAVLGMLTALAVAGRALMAPIPNVQPATFIIIISGYVFGSLSGFMVGSTTALVSNFLLGHGPWTIWQMLAWGLAGLTAGLLRKGERLEGRTRLALFCAAWGLIYGLLLNVYFVLGFVRPVTARAFLTAYATGVWFDAFHAAGNFAFAFLLGPALIAMLRRYRARFHFERADEPSGTPGRAMTAGRMEQEIRCE